MNDMRKLAERYIATWNTTDATARRKAVEELWTEDGTYLDPMADVAGHEGIDTVIGAVQAQFPDLSFVLGAKVDAHHNIARFTWELGPVAGFDVIEVAEDGRIQHVRGFLDKVPA